MKKRIFFAFTLTAVSFVFCLQSCSDSNEKNAVQAKQDPEVSKALPEDTIKHGEYLVAIMGCNHCHSPKKMGAKGPEIIPELLLSGFPSDRPLVKFDSKLIKSGFPMFYPDLTGAAGPWGVSFAANLTPDKTGIGDWTEQQFLKALTQGKFKGLENTRSLLPPMPWEDFAVLSDYDLKSIFAYLKSIKPVKNVVPNHVSPDKM